MNDKSVLIKTVGGGKITMTNNVIGGFDTIIDSEKSVEVVMDNNKITSGASILQLDEAELQAVRDILSKHQSDEEVAHELSKLQRISEWAKANSINLLSLAATVISAFK